MNINKNKEYFQTIKEKQIIKIISYEIESKKSKGKFVEIQNVELLDIIEKIGQPKLVFNFIYI